VLLEELAIISGLKGEGDTGDTGLWFDIVQYLMGSESNRIGII
jgi:hypothetical protein